MTFWQGIVISFIAHAVYKQQDADSDYDATEWSKEAQSFLICLEMFMFAIVHCFVFPVEEWEPGYQEKAKRRIKAQFGDSLALRDFVRDVKLVMRSRKSKRGGLEKIPQRDDLSDINGSAVMTEAGDDLEIDWSNGWGRIEQYLDLVEEEGSSDGSGDIENDTQNQDTGQTQSDEKDEKVGQRKTENDEDDEEEGQKSYEVV